jgi:RNA-binding protein YhbY
MVMGNIQIGKNGISYNFIPALESLFKNHNLVKVSVLKSARGDGKEAKKTVKEYEKQIMKKLGNKYTSRIIGFTIVIRKWRKAVRE